MMMMMMNKNSTLKALQGKPSDLGLLSLAAPFIRQLRGQEQLRPWYPGEMPGISQLSLVSDECIALCDTSPQIDRLLMHVKWPHSNVTCLESIRQPWLLPVHLAKQTNVPINPPKTGLISSRHEIDATIHPLENAEMKGNLLQTNRLGAMFLSGLVFIGLCRVHEAIAHFQCLYHGVLGQDGHKSVEKVRWNLKSMSQYTQKVILCNHSISTSSWSDPGGPMLGPQAPKQGYHGILYRNIPHPHIDVSDLVWSGEKPVWCDRWKFHPLCTIGVASKSLVPFVHSAWLCPNPNVAFPNRWTSVLYLKCRIHVQSSKDNTTKAHLPELLDQDGEHGGDVRIKILNLDWWSSEFSCPSLQSAHLNLF